MNQIPKTDGTLIIVSGPSGAGKGTLLERLFHELDNLSYSVSCTTRGPRPGEIDGVDYHFITEERFQTLKDAGEFLEYADVHAHHYGTLRADVLNVLRQGRDVILEIDVQGALQVKQKMPEALTVFIAPPSLEVLEKRLRGRHTETEEQIELRLRNARLEMQQKELYDIVIINDALDSAVRQLRNAVEGSRAQKQ